MRANCGERSNSKLLGCRSRCSTMPISSRQIDLRFHSVDRLVRRDSTFLLKESLLTEQADDNIMPGSGPGR